MENTQIDQPINESKVVPRKPWLAALLSILVTGVGQFYNGQPIKGVAVFLVDIAAIIVCIALHLMDTFAGMIVGFGLLTVIWFYGWIEAAITAKRLKDYVPNKYNEWYYYLLVIALMWGLRYGIGFQERIGLQSYTIPTSANSPAVKVGDWIMCSHRAYDGKAIKYGDFVSYLKTDGFTYISRVVALPGDRIQMLGDTVLINGKRLSHVFVSNIHSDDVGYGSEGFEYTETFPDGKKHEIWLSSHPYTDSSISQAEITLDDHSYYIMGDNRNNSLDSRYIGPISREKITGQMLYTYWGESLTRINIDLRDK